MMWSSLLLLAVTVLISTSAQQVSFVKTNESAFEHCPGQPCLTLEQYAQQGKTFFKTGTTFIFLPGNHTLESTVNLTSLSAVTFIANDSDSIVIIACRNAFIRCENVKNLTIRGLVFELLTSSREYSALMFHSSTGILISKSSFQGSGKGNTIGSRAVHSEYSVLNILSCYFDGNTGDSGGAILAVNSNVTLSGNVFTRNKAIEYGGAIFALESYIRINEYVSNLSDNTTAGAGKLLDRIALENHITQPGTAMYSNNEAEENGGALCLADSSALLSGRVIKFINNSAKYGGAIFIIQQRFASHLATNTEYLYFTGNLGSTYKHAVIYSKFASLSFGEGANNNHYFLNNTPAAIFCQGEGNTVNISGNSYFINNGYYSYLAGGAIRILGPEFFLTGNATFHNSRAKYYGGAISLDVCNATFDGENIEFRNNAASEGGAIYSTDSHLIISAKQLVFLDNTALKTGGAIKMYNVFPNSAMITGNFVNNSASECGGAVSIVAVNNVTIINIVATGNSECALCVASSRVVFTGSTIISNNSGKFGGGVNSRNSIILFTDNIEFGYNKALLGGAMYSTYGEVVFQKGVRNSVAQFMHNRADRDGGVLYVTGTNVTLKRLVHYEFNSAQNGGVIYFNTGARLNLDRQFGAIFSASFNEASEYGGVLYHEDQATFVQCDFIDKEVVTDILPFCSLQLLFPRNDFVPPATSYMNSAKRGNFIYGGLLDRCRLKINLGKNKNAVTALEYLDLFSIFTNLTDEMASSPYQLCFCERNSINVTYNCSAGKSFSVYRGQLLRISLIALDQMTTAVSAQVTAITNSTAQLELGQNPQILPQNCSNLTYNFYSTKAHEQVILYPDGPCHDSGLASAVLNLTILPCPDAFTLSASGERCECEKRLKDYGAQCVINDTIYITKEDSSNFWMSNFSINGIYQGLVLYKNCPFEYCKRRSVRVTLDNLDIQCGYNRSGVLCGKCADNHSLLLSSFECQICSNNYLAMLVLFAAAGIILVIFLSVLRITVATGMVNSIILYANIVQVNKSILFTGNEKNIFTVFIAWLNLDLGFQTCFYNGMNAYTQTWLQFAFPLYVWTIISMIIVISRYSVTLSKLIGHNPIAVLATLLLMSYTKVLKIVIEVYASVNLEYPDNKTVTVWLKDGNMPYLQSWHLLLTVVTSLVLVFLFLPYTLLLLLGYKLYRFSGRKHMRWLNRLKPLLDSYYAPYKTHTRYWTGFLLLVRCALYIVFSYNSLGATNNSLLAIIITFTTVVIIAWLSISIYEKLLLNITEASMYLNLIILSAATLAGANTTPLVSSLVGVVFVAMIGVIIYHFHIHFTAKSIICLHISEKLASIKETMKARTTTTPLPLDIPVNASSHDQHRIVTKSVLNLREPLLDDPQ